MNESPSGTLEAHGASGYLTRQFSMAWQLTAWHLEGLTTGECLWRPAGRGLHLHQADGS